MAFTKLLATLTLPAALALGACGIEEADQASETATEAVADGAISDEEINEWSFDVVWNAMAVADRQMICDGAELYGWNWAGEQISIGAEGQISPAQATELLRDHCS